MQRPHQFDEAARAGRGLRVPVDEAAAERIHGVDVGTRFACEPEVVDRERVVRLDDVDVGELKAGVIERDGRRGDRGLGHLAASDAREAAGEEPDRWGTDFPYGTLLINVSGSFAIGVVLAFVGDRVGISLLWRFFLATGFLGGYTTFSAYSWEALSLVEQGAWLRAGVYVIGSNVLGFVGVWLGATLARLTPS